MFWFGLGGFLVYAATVGVSFVLRRDELSELSSDMRLQVALGVIVLPVFVQAMVAELTARVLRKRIFDVRLRSRFAPFVLGVITAVLSVVTVAGLLPFVNDLRYEIACIAIPAIFYSCVIIACTPRIRKGVCLHCNYAISADMARCPECGKFSNHIVKEQISESRVLEEHPTGVRC